MKNWKLEIGKMEILQLL